MNNPFTDYFWNIVAGALMCLGFLVACYLVYLGYQDYIAMGGPTSWK